MGNRVVPRHLRKLWARAGHRALSAIRAMCVECMGYERAEVERCTATSCPLHPWRFGKYPAGVRRVRKGTAAGVCKKDTPKE
jgi:hypothetical protein